jgi:hypothetical protein
MDNGYIRTSVVVGRAAAAQRQQLCRTEKALEPVVAEAHAQPMADSSSNGSGESLRRLMLEHKGTEPSRWRFLAILQQCTPANPGRCLDRPGLHAPHAAAATAVTEVPPQPPSLSQIVDGSLGKPCLCKVMR